MAELFSFKSVTIKASFDIYFTTFKKGCHNNLIYLTSLTDNVKFQKIKLGNRIMYSVYIIVRAKQLKNLQLRKHWTQWRSHKFSLFPI